MNKRITINMAFLEDAFDSNDGLYTSYLDLETGKVIDVSEDIQFHSEMMCNEHFDSELGIMDWQKAFEEEGTSQWEQDSILEWEEIQLGLDTRYL